MQHKVYIGIDNGVTGTIGWVGENGHGMAETPTFMEQNYTKKAKNISRVDIHGLASLLNSLLEGGILPADCMAVLERPMVNPGRFDATVSAVRALEATLITLEGMGIPHMYTDSRAWQKELLPEGLEGAPVLKKASMDIGLRLFPDVELVNRHKDADGLLIAEWARRHDL